jgi:Ca2+:H+ antiporter
MSMSQQLSGAASASIFARYWQSIFAIAALPFAIVIHNSNAAITHAKLGSEIALLAAAIALLLPTVIIALHHAEKIAARIGEPFGTLLLTLAVTIIEVSIIVSIMLNGDNNPTLARESVFSVMMIVCTGGVGLCLTLGALRHGEQDHQPQGTNAYLAVLAALSVLSLILPNFTLTTIDGTYSTAQLIFISALSLLLYSAFLYIQTVRHRSYFIEQAAAPETSILHADNSPLGLNLICLLAGLASVVLLAERVAAGVESGLDAIGVQRTDAIIGALIATLLLFPELLAALKAALHNQLQRSINVLLGSALATIGLTIPAVAAASLITGRELTLGLVGRDEVMLVLALMLSMISFGTGRTHVLTGMVHLVVFFAYLMLLVIP